MAHHLPPADWGHLLDNWQDLGAAGIIHKATQGTGFVDKEFERRRRDCSDAKIPFAAYHFMNPGYQSNIKEQMALFSRVATGGITMFLDYEADGLVLSDLRQAFQYIEQFAPANHKGLYGGGLLKEQLGSTFDPQLAAYPLWLAHYNDNPTWPRETWPKWRLWQYNSHFNVGNKRYEIDVNVFDGTPTQLRRWFNPPEDDAVAA